MPDTMNIVLGTENAKRIEGWRTLDCHHLPFDWLPLMQLSGTPDTME